MCFFFFNHQYSFMMRRLFTHAIFLAIAGLFGGFSLAQPIVVTNTNSYVENFDNLQSTGSCTGFGPTTNCNLTSDWSNLSNDDYDWRPNTGTTGSGSTGPGGGANSACTNDTCPVDSSNGYLFAETSSPGFPAKKYNLQSPEFDISGLNAPIMTFFYHMYGIEQGTLNVFVDNGTTRGLVFTISGQQQSSSNADWVQGTADLCGFGNVVKVVFEYTSGTNFRGDIGLDKVEVKAGSASSTDIAVSGLDALVSCPGPITLPPVTVGNKGAVVVSGIVVNWDVDGVAQTPVSVPGSLAPCASATVNLGGINLPSGGATVRAWVDVANDGNAANDTVTQNYIPSLQGTFTVNSDVAASATNFTSFSSMASTLSAAGVCGPVTINVVAGSGPYSEKFVINEIPGASATNTITINGNGERINFNGSSSQRACIILDGADWVTIENLILDGASGSFGFGILLTNQANNNTIRNNEIRLNTGSTTSLIAGIVASGSLTSAASNGNNANNTLVEGNTINGGYYAINFNNQGSTSLGDDVTIRNNTLTNVYYYGIRVYYMDNVIIENNDVRFRASASAFSDAIYTFYASHPTITNNKLIGWKNTGIYLSSANTTSTGTTDRGLVANNFISDNGTANGSDYGIDLLSTLSRNMDIVYNSIYLGGSGSNLWGIYVRGSNSSNRANIVNNAISVMGSGSSHALRVTSANYEVI
jgi:parallel beta-helix repeat protein